MRKKLLLLALFFFWATSCFAQYVDTAWVRRYNGPGNSTDNARKVKVDSSGNVYVTGFSYGSGTDADYATIKYYPDGDTTWVKRYNGPGNSRDWAHAMAVDYSENVYVTGESRGSGMYDDYATIKYYHNGDTAWLRRYNSSENYDDRPRPITLDDSGNVYVSGLSFGSGTDWDYATLKYYSNGDSAWASRYNGPGNGFDAGDALAVDGSGNAYVTGPSYGSGTDWDYATIKYDPNGGAVWVSRFDGPANSYDQPWAIAVDDSGNVYITGGSTGSGTSVDYATIKYNPSGDTAWVRRYNGLGNAGDYAHSIIVDGSGNVYVTGQSYGSGTDWDFATIKYDPDGDTVWIRRYNGSGNSGDVAWAVEVDVAGNVYVTGWSSGSGTGNDYATIKYNSNGDNVWVSRYNGPGNGEDTSFAIAVDGSGNVYVTGPSYGSGTDADYATIKYIQPIPFDTAMNYLVGNAPYSVFNGDLDGDGDLDLVTANAYSSDVSVLKNNGNGTFQPKVDKNVDGDYPYTVSCADLDGDGDLDLAVAHEGSDGSWIGNAYILKNEGNGTFQTPVNYGTGTQSTSVFCADLDGDTDLDLAVGNLGSDNVSILKNNGDGTFQTKVDYDVGNAPASVFCADLDGDNDLDLAVANWNSDSVSILKNNGDGIFQTKVDYAAGDGPHSIFCADLDGDIDLDLAVANGYSDSVSILKNNGDGTFQTKVDYAAGDNARSVFCADLDGDGDLDLAVANQGSDNVSVLKNNGDGTFESAYNHSTADGASSVFSADLDGDGDLDLAVANVGTGNVSILKNLTQVPANQPPWAFSLVSPTYGDTTGAYITFLWQASYDPNFGDQIRYDLYMSKVPGFDLDSTVVYDSLPLSKHTVALALGIDTYYWKVKAYDNWGAERWSTQSWTFVEVGLPETLWYAAYSPVDLIVTAPNGDSIGVNFNTIPNATYDTTTDKNLDGDKDDIVTIPNPLTGEYQVKVIREAEIGPGDTSYSLGIRIDGSNETVVIANASVPPPDQVDTVTYEVLLYLRGDANSDGKKTVSDAVFLINYLFKGGPAPSPLLLGDGNCCHEGKEDCQAVSVSVSDVVYLINYLFKGGPPPCS